MPLPGKPPALRAASAALALALVAAPAGAATVVLDTLGAGNAWDGWGWIGPGPTGVVELGFVFTAPVSATIGALTVPLSSQAPPSDLTFSVYQWDGTGVAGQVDLAPVKLSSDQPELFVVDEWSVPLVQGREYALLASAATASSWWQAEGQPSVHSIYRLDGGPAVDATYYYPAVRLELATPGPTPAPVPVPGALGLILAALAGLGLTGRRSRRAGMQR